MTPEDEERRRRRRERNKIAATKCRLKKREKTVHLVQESEILETQNIDLKTQIQELESQRRRLVDMLSMHTPACVKTNKQDHYSQNNLHYTVEDAYSNEGPLPPVTSLSTSVIETNHAYNRPTSVDPSFRQHDVYNNRSGITNDNSYTRTTIQYAKPTPSIIIEGDNYSPPSQLTNLDNPGISYHYNSNQCHNYNSPSNTSQSYGSPSMDNGCMA